VRFAAIVAAVLVLSGCAPTAPPLHGAWRLIEGSDAAGALPLDDSHPVTIEFDDGRVSGTAACNSYSGDVSGTLTSLTFANLSQTELGCVPASVMEVESRYLAALGGVTATADGDSLTLSGPSVSLRFDAQE